MRTTSFLVEIPDELMPYLRDYMQRHPDQDGDCVFTIGLTLLLMANARAEGMTEAFSAISQILANTIGEASHETN